MTMSDKNLRYFSVSSRLRSVPGVVPDQLVQEEDCRVDKGQVPQEVSERAASAGCEKHHQIADVAEVVCNSRKSRRKQPCLVFLPVEHLARRFDGRSDKFMPQPHALRSEARPSQKFISRVWTLLRVKSIIKISSVRLTA
jgi:hypothetical protein